MTTILILAAIGMAAILAELVLPGGVLGILGILFLVAAVVATFTGYGAGWGLVALVILAVIGLTTLNLWMRFFHRLPFTRNLMLNDEVGRDEELDERQELTGETGTALTDIHPSGRAQIGDNRVDVMAEGQQIKKGATIKVVSTSGPSIFVREIDTE